MADGSSSSRDLASDQNSAAPAAAVAGPSGSSASSSAAPSAAAAAAAKSCAHCHKAEEVADADDEEASSNLKPCIACKSVLYCSRDCKKAHLKQHKKACPKLAQEYAKTADIKMAPRAPPKAETHRGGLQKWQFDT